MVSDVTIQFHRSQWWHLTEEAQQLISAYCGPVYPDANDVITITVGEERWREIEKANQQQSPREGRKGRRK